MNDDPSNTEPPPPPEHHKTRKSWIIGGIALAFVGLAMLPTIFLAGVGLFLMVIGACIASFGFAGDRIKEKMR